MLPFKSGSNFRSAPLKYFRRDSGNGPAVNRPHPAGPRRWETVFWIAFAGIILFEIVTLSSIATHSFTKAELSLPVFLVALLLPITHASATVALVLLIWFRQIKNPRKLAFAIIFYYFFVAVALIIGYRFFIHHPSTATKYYRCTVVSYS
jgi:hypothetical protein